MKTVHDSDEIGDNDPDELRDSMKLSRAGVLVLVGISVPVAIELRTLFGFFGVELPLTAVAVFEAVLLLAILVAYSVSEKPGTTTEH